MHLRSYISWWQFKPQRINFIPLLMPSARDRTVIWLSDSWFREPRYEFYFSVQDCSYSSDHSLVLNHRNKFISRFRWTLVVIQCISWNINMFLLRLLWCGYIRRLLWMPVICSPLLYGRTITSVPVNGCPSAGVAKFIEPKALRIFLDEHRHEHI